MNNNECIEIIDELFILIEQAIGKEVKEWLAIV